MTAWLIDTDVLIDVAAKREQFLGPSLDVLAQLSEVSETVFVSWHTISNLNYVVGNLRSRLEARHFIATLLDFAQVARTSTDHLRYALSLPMPDFEDAMQVAAARARGARFIVTRNVRDFDRSPIPVLSPADALAELSR